jgi:hypothetical protein
LQAIDDWVFKTPGLRALLLNEDEWETLGKIADILEVVGLQLHHNGFPNLQPLQQPFTEVTLQMSHSNVPTIPFVLPLYQKMEKHLEAVLISLEHSLKIQYAAEQGLAKLRKYSAPAKLHHSYILGTSKLCLSLDLKDKLGYYIIVLHPCLRSHWFAATADPDDAAAQEEAIKTAEVIFR